VSSDEREFPLTKEDAQTIACGDIREVDGKRWRVVSVWRLGEEHPPEEFKDWRLRWIGVPVCESGRGEP
jgi:hypothetical protein